jgi:cell division protease FtsH
MGGRAAEEVIFNQITTGALSDLEKVTKQARAIVTVYGLNNVIGNVTYYDSSGQNEYQFDKPYSENTAQIIDEEISKLIEIQYERAKKILRENKDKLTSLAEELLKKEVIFKENLETIFGKRQWLTAEEKLQASLNAEAEIDASSKKKTSKKGNNTKESELISDEQKEND